jgi:NitT/TauT family transport system ATP-binding protein
MGAQVTSTGDIALVLDDVTIQHGSGTQQEVVAVQGFSSEFRRGQCTALVGPSGCGKTTLLDAIAGLKEPSKGRIEFRPKPRRIGYFFQDYPFLPAMSARRHIGFPLRSSNISQRDAGSEVSSWLERVGLTPASERSIPALSEGMRARVALATTLIAGPELVLLDEPFGPLDLQTRIAMWRELRRFRDRSGATVVLVTHDLNEAIVLADRILVLRASPGRVVAERSVAIDRGRDVLETLQTEQVSRLHRQLWSDLGTALQP